MMDKPEPKEIPPGVSPVRFIMADKHPYHPLKGFEEAKLDPDGVAVLEGDYGGQIMLTARMSYVKCSEKELDLLLFDLNELYWNGYPGTGLFYERAKIGDGIAGGMGGGCVVDGVWIHPKFEESKLIDSDVFGRAVGDILERRSKRLPENLRRNRGQTRPQ